MGTRRRVLVVDDEDSIREIARLSLEAVAGWDVLTARSGAEALELAGANHPEAILTDVMMPTMDGPTLVGHLQQRPDTRDIPVVFLTARVRPEDSHALQAIAGVSGLLAKPFDPMTLAADLAKVLQWEE